MIVRKIITINSKEYLHTFSDSGMLIERDGVMYSDAIDPIESGRTYSESSLPIEEYNTIMAEREADIEGEEASP